MCLSIILGFVPRVDKCLRREEDGPVGFDTLFFPCSNLSFFLLFFFFFFFRLCFLNGRSNGKIVFGWNCFVLAGRDERTRQPGYTSFTRSHLYMIEGVGIDRDSAVPKTSNDEAARYRFPTSSPPRPWFFYYFFIYEHSNISVQQLNNGATVVFSPSWLRFLLLLSCSYGPLIESCRIHIR